jgi:hypothetical protein
MTSFNEKGHPKSIVLNRYGTTAAMRDGHGGGIMGWRRTFRIVYRMAEC